MQSIIEFVSQPWHWSISGVMIVFVMFLLKIFGQRFGVSSNLKTMCAIGGAGRNVDFFRFDWKEYIWNLTFIGGAVVGGFIAFYFLASPDPVQIADATKDHLMTLGVNTPGNMEDGAGFVPGEIFSLSNLNIKNILFLVIGGFLIGFGTRYAGGCTSGHAISGLANLQLPSLVAVIGFFIGGLTMAWIILPIILK